MLASLFFVCTLGLTLLGNYKPAASLGVMGAAQQPTPASAPAGASAPAATAASARQALLYRNNPPAFWLIPEFF